MNMTGYSEIWVANATNKLAKDGQPMATRDQYRLQDSNNSEVKLSFVEKNSCF